MTFRRQDVNSWPSCKPYIIAHDVARSRDFSTAVIGGHCPYDPGLAGIQQARQLQPGLYGSARASELAAIDREFGATCLIVADLSNDATYAEPLFEAFGPRLIGLQISRSGDGTNFERRPVKGGTVLVYTIGRSQLIERLHGLLNSQQVLLADNPMMRQAYDQLVNLVTEYRDTGTVYSCPVGQHDDLGISCAMLAWAAHHPHLSSWIAPLVRRHRPRGPKFNWAAVT